MCGKILPPGGKTRTSRADASVIAACKLARLLQNQLHEHEASRQRQEPRPVDRMNRYRQINDPGDPRRPEQENACAQHNKDSSAF